LHGIARESRATVRPLHGISKKNTVRGTVGFVNAGAIG
jgi:hypothetical protein